MCRVVSTALPGNARSPGRARAWTRTWLESWDIDDDGVSTLLVSELVTNAVKYTLATSTLTLAVADGMIEVAVTDHGFSRHAIPAERPLEMSPAARVLSEDGRGLMIVEALSHNWGVTANGMSKQVWFRRPVAADWPYTATCTCRPDDPTAHCLASGRAAVAVPGPWDHRGADGTAGHHGRPAP
jgi:anti-sigma regulatory factor (Ser/Thr protein kinase)